MGGKIVNPALSVTVDSIIIKDCFPEDLTFLDFVTADDNLVTFAHTDSDDSGSEERPSASLSHALEDSETEADKVTDGRALQGISTLINHCSQRAEVDPRATQAFQKYRVKVMKDYLSRQRQSEIRTYFPNSSQVTKGI